ncbi:MAG: ATP-binding protein [Pseudomonadota bacterium]
MTALTLPSEENDVRVQLFRKVCDQIADIVLIADEDGAFKYVNKAVERVLGYTPDELIGRPVREIVHPPDWVTAKTLRMKLLAGEIQKDTRDRRYVAKNGELVVCSTSNSAVYGADGRGQYVLGVIRDVREERETSKNLEKALVAAQEATRLKSEFLANMSHEIRTPLNGVFGMAQALEASALTPEQQEYVGILIDSGKTLLTLLNDILDLSKIEAGKIELSPVDVDLRHRLRRICAVHETIAREKGLDFHLDVSPAIPAQVLVDPIRIRQCIDNLISNAIKFTAEGRIAVTLKADPCDDGSYRLHFSVSDTGVGVSEEKQAQIFRSFEQADASTSRVYGGTGLGLAISKRLAALMGGDLTIDSVVGEGSTFNLTVRAEPVAADISTAEANAAAAAKRTDTLPPGLHILVADDNEVNRRVVDLFLKKLGVRMTHAIDGEEVLARLGDSGPFDLILLDIHMPKMDGVTAFKKIRASDAPWRDIPVLALTADAMSNDRDKYLAMGMQDYLAKPVNQRDLVASVARLCGVFDAPRKAAG